ncbi:MAG: hypothetical protein IPO62_12155 [Saprospiraceae bacterium]|nr:hypothetical protein [Saprospiraceae bacterium]
MDPPVIDCFNGTPLHLVSNSLYDSSYTSESISFFDLMNQALTNVPYNKSMNSYFIEVSNGDSIKVRLTYTTLQCPDIDTIFVIGTKFLPELNFHSDTVCFSDSTTIFNQSNFSQLLSSVDVIIEGINPNFTEKGDFKCFLDSNGINRRMFVTINQDGCIQSDTFDILNLRKPKGIFSFDKTCENERQVINNLSTSTSNFSVIVLDFYNKKDSFFAVNNSHTISDTIPDGMYPVFFRVTNSNGCSDTSSYTVIIDSVTYISFSGLELDYCENQDSSILMGSQTGGLFSGLFIKNTSPGMAEFKPLFDTTNLIIKYSYTNALGCKDSTSIAVSNIYPKPNLILSGLENTYCEKDSPSILTINQPLASNSFFSEFRNSMNINDTSGLLYKFNPIIPGNYTIVNMYIDQNGCFSEIQESTIVYPLPKINLDSLVILSPGNTILVNNTLPDEPGVSYEWSNSDIGSFTRIDQPGLYILRAINNITLCEISDTIQIKYDENIKEDLLNIRIYPNPTSDKINISLSNPKNGIKIFRFNGNQVSINGNSSFSTDVFGELVLDVINLEAGYYVLMIPSVGDF